MLDSLRAFASTWVAKILIGFLMVGLAGFGISNVFLGLGGATVARVGTQEISSNDFQREFQSQINAMSQRTGSLMTAEQAIAQGIPNNVIASLASDATLNELADRFGLGASEEMIAESIRANPGFGSTLGNFDREAFRQAIRLQGYTEDGYLQREADTLKRRQLALALFSGVDAPDTLKQIMHRYQEDRRTLNFFTVDNNSITAIPAPDDTILATYLEENQARYRTVETRTVQALLLSPEIAARSIEISDEAVAAEYERTAQNYARPETRTVHQLVMPSEGTANWFRNGYRDGKTWEEMIETSGLADRVTDLGTVTRGELLDATLAETAFGLDAGGVAIVSGVSGFRAIHVSDIVPAGQEPLENVSDEIRDRLALAQARDTIAETIDDIEELRAGATPVTDIASRFDLDVYEITLNRQGSALSAIEALPAEAHPQIASAIFNARETGLTPSIPLSANTNFWFDLEAVTPARDQTLDEAREALTEAWTTQQADQAKQARAEELVALVGDGLDFSDVASRDSQMAQLSIPIGRTGDTSIPASVASRAYGGGVGYVNYARTPDGNYIVFEVEAIVPAEDELDTQTEAIVDQAMLQTVYSEFLQANQRDFGVSTNAAAIQQVLDALTGN